jgi:hypothetical protein
MGSQNVMGSGYGSNISEEPVVQLQTQKKEPRLDCQWSINANFSEIAFSVGYLHKVGSKEFRFQAINQLVCFRCI